VNFLIRRICTLSVFFLLLSFYRLDLGASQTYLYPLELDVLLRWKSISSVIIIFILPIRKLITTLQSTIAAEDLCLTSSNQSTAQPPYIKPSLLHLCIYHFNLTLKPTDQQSPTPPQQQPWHTHHHTPSYAQHSSP